MRGMCTREETYMVWHWWYLALVAITLVGGLVGFYVVGFRHLLWPFYAGPKPTRKEKVDGFVKGVLYTAETLFLANSLIAALPLAEKTFQKLLHLLGLQFTQFVITVVVVIVGYLAFRFKLKYQAAYGSVEIIFAAAVTIVTVEQMTSARGLMAVATSLGAAVYVVSRGCGNLHEGMATAAQAPRRS
jgi:MFS family permease